MKLAARALIAVSMALISAGLFAEGESIRRFALIAGSNVGGKTTSDLRYAANDAKRMRDVLVRIGGIAEEDAMLLINPEKQGLSNGIAYIGNKIRKATGLDVQTQLLFYYSGHSDERGLLLFGDYYSYADLRAALDALGAEVRVVILDSCSSGAFSRTKGGSINPPFLIDESSSVEGHAYITSSTAEEMSQESDKIESSFFTYYLLNGLRGAADSNGDGKVTLNEAYDYAYDRTLSETEKTRAGAQHPEFDIVLNGMGNLVLTDLRAGEAVLKVPKALAGKLTLRDVSDKLVLELRKTDERDMYFSVEQGYYRVLLEEGKSLYETTLIVDEKREYELRRETFHVVKVGENAVRGAYSSPLALFPLGLSLAADEGGLSLYLNLIGGKAFAVNGLMASLLYNQTVGASSGYQGSLFANAAGGDFAGAQGSLGPNIAQGDLFGLQVSALYNETVGNLKGLQLSPINRADRDVKIGQAGAINIAQGEGSYFQVGGLNWSRTSILGLQAGAVNIGKSVQGAQVGLVNYSEDQTGVQVGIINISKRMNGLPIGILDIQANGENHVDAVISSSTMDLRQNVFTSLYFRMGSRYFYKYFDVSGPRILGGAAEDQPYFFAGAGLGFRIPAFFEGLAFHIDGGANYQSSIPRLELVEDPNFWQKIVPQFRVFASCKIFKSMGLMAGLEQRVYTKNFHSIPSGAGNFEILTDYGNLVFDSRFFLGVQL